MIFFRMRSALSLLLLIFLASCSKPTTPAPQASGVPPAAATPIDPSTTASISGVVRFTGLIPAARKIDMSADSGCKGQNQSETVLVNEGRLANVLVYVKDGLAGSRLRSASGEDHHCAAGMPLRSTRGCGDGGAAGRVPRQRRLRCTTFIPCRRTMSEWNQSQMPNGGPFAHTFTSPEIMIPVKCNQHPWMKMYLNVLGNPFYAVTGKDGSFELTGPASRDLHHRCGA